LVYISNSSFQEIKIKVFKELKEEIEFERKKNALKRKRFSTDFVLIVATILFECVVF